MNNWYPVRLDWGGLPWNRPVMRAWSWLVPCATPASAPPRKATRTPRSAACARTAHWKRRSALFIWLTSRRWCAGRANTTTETRAGCANVTEGTSPSVPRPRVPSPLTVLALLFALPGVAFLLAAGSALRRRRPVRVVTRLAFSLMLLAVGAVFGLLALGMQGYRALTHEALAAVVELEPLPGPYFRARFRFTD